MNNRSVGSRYESIAAEYIEKQSGQVLERNFRNRLGEIDIIIMDKNYLCFVEVKYRSSDRYGSPMEAVDYHKREQIKKVALSYINYKRISADTPIRFDCVGILGDKITWIKDAFR